MHVLVTGAGGFSGAYLVYALLGAGCKVTAFVGKNAARLESVSGHASLDVQEVDLSQGVSIPGGVTTVVHTAARSPAPWIKVSVERYALDNVLATARLAEAAARADVKKFIFFSSISAFGRVLGPVLDEGSPSIDPDPYGTSKLLGEAALKEFGFSSLSLRLPGVLGANAVRNRLSTMIETARDGREIPYFNGDALYNNAVHIADLAALVRRLLASSWHGHDMVVLGAAAPITVRQMVEMFAASAGGRARPRELASPRPPFILSHEKAIGLYGYNPMNMRDMVQRFLQDNGLADPTFQHS